MKLTNATYLNVNGINRRALRDNRNIIYELLESYNKEGLIMSYTFEDFYREFIKKHVDKLTTKERLR